MTFSRWRFLARAQRPLRAFSVLLVGLLSYPLFLAGGSPEASRPPRRIVSLAPSVTEILFAVGANGDLVGVSDFCHFPPGAEKLPKAGGLFNPNVEVIVSLRPDLVLISGKETEVEKRLNQLGIPVKGLQFDRLSEIRDSIRDLGRITGREEAANALIDTMARRIGDVSRRVATYPPARVLVVLSRTPGSLRGLYAVGPGSYLDDLLREAGGVNVLSQSGVFYPTIGVEQVIALDPDVILDTSLTGSAGPGTAARLRRDWETLRTLKAVKNGRVYMLSDPALTIPGSRIPEAIEAIARVLHPRAFSVTAAGSADRAP